MSGYDASAIEVLTGLEPVRRRPGMYTDTSRPNHLAQEVVDNSVDEALAGHATHVAVTLHPDGSLSVSDDGRGVRIINETDFDPARHVLAEEPHQDERDEPISEQRELPQEAQQPRKRGRPRKYHP